MPKMSCKCNYVFNLSYSPAENFYWVISDTVVDETHSSIEENKFEDFYEILGRENINLLFCPKCRRLWLRRGIDEKYEPYIKEE